MGKVKRKKPGIAGIDSHGKQGTTRRQHSQVLPSSTSKKPSTVNGYPVNQVTQRPKVPFNHHDRVLLIGEGDMSFALSLVKHHKPKCVTATCYDTQTQLIGKYPNVMSTISQLDPTATRMTEARPAKSNTSDSDPFEGFSPPPPPPTGNSTPPPPATSQMTSTTTRTRVLYKIDATKLSTLHRNILRPLGPFTKIVFNFPHVGGLSTDVNRQVRANQDLLVKFFEAAKPLLIAAAVAASSAQNSASAQQPRLEQGEHHQQASTERYDTPSSSSALASDDDDDDDHGDGDGDGRSNSAAAQTPPPPQTPQILISLFTAHPYTLWNIRDLARHAGYKVVESFRFPWEAYPGYRHARTLGDIVDKKGNKCRGGQKEQEEEEQQQQQQQQEQQEQRQGHEEAGEGGGEREEGEEERKLCEPANWQGKGKTKGKGRWKGEDREARCFVLELNDALGGGGGGRNRAAGPGEIRGKKMANATGKRKRSAGVVGGRGGGGGREESESD